MSVRALLLDMDGTMLDSERAMLDLYAVTAKRRGWVIDRKVAESTVGTTYQRTGEILLAAHPGLPNEEISREMGPVYMKMLQRGEVAVKPGLFALLDGAAQRGIPVGVCTSSHRDTVEGALRGCGAFERVSRMVCAGEAGRSKPCPEPYFLLAERMNVAIEECLVVEDSPHGAEAALAAGTGRVCVIPDFVKIPDELLARVTVLPSLQDVIPFLAEQRCGSRG